MIGCFPSQDGQISVMKSDIVTLIFQSDI